MNDLFLLGAGASVEAGVPPALGMTKRILEIVEGKYSHGEQARVLHFVVGGLLFQAGIRDQNPLNSGVDVEELFSAVQMLAERSNLEAAPFIGSWHTMIDELDRVQMPLWALDRLNKEIFSSVRGQFLDAFKKSPSSLEASKIDKTLALAVNKVVDAAIQKRRVSFSSSESLGGAVDTYISQVAGVWASKLKSSRPRTSHELESAFKRVLEDPRAQAGEGRVFKRTADVMIQVLKGITWIESQDKVEYLRPLARLAKAEGNLVVASLNYDNSVELACEAEGTCCLTGIEEWSRTGNFPVRGEGLHLLKLHGSINWRLAKREISPERPLPYVAVERVADVPGTTYEPAVIFGQRNKLTAEGPFLALLRAFEESLEQSSHLTVVGYSFRDDHVNTQISRWLNQDDSHFMTVVDPKFDNSSVNFVGLLNDLRKGESPKVVVVQKGAGEALPELCDNIASP